jgi:molecular chaperone Hsp33
MADDASQWRSDALKKFLFDDRSVRIESVRMETAWLAAQTHQQYPAPVTALLGELVAASTLLAANLKFDGSLLLQLQGDGAIALMVVECRADLSIRATVKMRDRPLPAESDLQAMLNPGGTAKFIVVLDPPKHTPGRQAYQGIVPLEGTSVAQALEQYMLRSEQLHTRIWLAADSLHCSGLLIQRLPLQGGAQQTEIQAHRVAGRADDIGGCLGQQRSHAGLQILHTLGLHTRVRTAAVTSAHGNRRNHGSGWRRRRRFLATACAFAM